MVKVNNIQSAFKPKLELWGISTWKKKNWRISVLPRTGRMFVWPSW